MEPMKPHSLSRHRGAILALATFGVPLVFPMATFASDVPSYPIPIIFDTDIGSDIDDTWALAYLLNCPELETKLVVTASGDTEYRARVTARFLEVAKASHIPIGIGVRGSPGNELQKPWVEDYELSAYSGTVHEDGVQAMIEIIHASPEPVTILAVGPVTNIHEALRRDPSIAAKCRFVGMHGSIDVGYGGGDPVNEYNVRADVPAFRAVMEADWIDAKITPLDTCGDIILDGDRYQSVFESDRPMMVALMENYSIWSKLVTWVKIDSIEQRSSALFDTVAVYMTYTDRLLKYETTAVAVDEDGYTRRSDSGPKIQVAMEWTDKNGFLDHLTERLLK